jgi:hypothetical protein
MKKAIYAVFSVFAMLLSCAAMAQTNPDLVANSTGTQVFNLTTALGVAPASQATGGNPVILYEGSTGWQPVTDTGGKYVYIRDRLVAAHGAIEVGTGTGVFYVPQRARIGCQGSPLGSYIQADNTANPRTDYMVNDACAYRDKVRLKAN